jgi:hypothetical protein
MIGVLNFKSLLFDGILNDGEDSIFMGEGKFREFMKTVEGITNIPTEDVAPVIQISTDIEAETEELELFTAPKEIPDQKEEEASSTFPGDDDVLTSEPEESVSRPSASTDAPDPAALIAGGLDFFSGLAKTFSSPEATQKLVSSIVDKDPVSGKTYLKIPVENEKVIADALTLFGQLFNAFGKR